MTDGRLYKLGTLVDTNFSLDDLSSHISVDGNFAWVDLVSPSREELKQLGVRLKLNELSVEDVYKGKQRPKLDIYPTHLFINTYWINALADGGIDVHEIGIFVTPQVIITVRSGSGFDVSEFEKYWDTATRLADNGVAYLLWGILDCLIDKYFDVLNVFDVELEKLEELIFSGKVSEKNADSEIQKKTYRFRKGLVSVKHLATPIREILNSLVKHDNRVIRGTMASYFQDLYDHSIRLGDWVESVRDLITTLVDTNLNIQGYRMNIIMKKITSWAAIISVPTAITGFYGQNIPYPGFGLVWGWWMSIGLIVGISGALYISFRKRGWL